MTKELIQDYTLKISESSRTGIIVIMYDLAEIYIQDAIRAFDDNNHEEYRKQCANVGKIVRHLIEALDFSNSLAVSLYRIYEYIAKEISLAVIKRDPEKLQRISKYFASLKGSFEQIADQDTSGPAMGNGQSVYAGLTYGKGVLNESMQVLDPNRGFSV